MDSRIVWEFVSYKLNIFSYPPSGGFFFSTHSLYLRTIINHKLIKMKKYLLFGIAIVFSFGVNAQWKGTTTNDDQRTMMVQRHMDLYPKNDQSHQKIYLTRHLQ